MQTFVTIVCVAIVLGAFAYLLRRHRKTKPNIGTGGGSVGDNRPPRHEQ
jgi:hypothetical protein